MVASQPPFELKASKMKQSQNRILTTHVGSLPRSKAVTDVVFALENGQDIDKDKAERVIRRAVRQVVIRQAEAGIDVVSDGEMSKISYATYIKDRITGFDGDSPREPPADLEDFPVFMQKLSSSGGTPSYKKPCCVGEIRTRDTKPLKTDLSNFTQAMELAPVVEGFMNAASPGVIALFQPNQYYPDHDAYLEALANAMQVEYEAITKAGFILQLDSPDLGLGRHMMFKDKTDREYQALAHAHVEALNYATRNIAPEQMRLHVCWGNYEGPHHCDAPMSMVLPIALKARPQALLFEASNPRHAHEWTVFRDAEIPADKILVPGVLDSTTNFVEHTELVAERLCRFADIVGRERLMAGTDCGFSTFAGFGSVDEDIVYAKLGAMVGGAKLASQRLWP
jgi:5-methyltetrahydropteroyltriglutamate--homocysteine methyltransferase